MSPFVYPKATHVRQLSPRVFRRYRTYKGYLRKEFARKCVYCRMPDGMKGWAQFGVEHYRPKERFPGLECTYSNLYYCCNDCNSRKGEYWPSRGYEKTRFIPNPCDHVMFDHVRFSGTQVAFRTLAGRTMVDLLQLNDREVVEYRQFMMDMLDGTSQRCTGIEKDIASAKKRLASASQQEAATLQAAITKLEAILERLRRHLKRLRGE